MSETTRSRIVDAAETLFYAHGLRSVSVDAIAAQAGVTKRTLYYHFESKDALIAAYLEARDASTRSRYRDWLGDDDRPLPDRIERMFVALASHAAQPKWRGCGFTRAAVELAGQPGHPAVLMAADHKRRFEAWLAEELRSSGAGDPETLAQQVMLLLDGAIALMLVHRDVTYARVAGEAAATLVSSRIANRLGSGRNVEVRAVG